MKPDPDSKASARPVRDIIADFLAQGPYAVVGASTNRDKFGNKVLRAYQRKGFKVYPINPREPEIEGLKAYVDLKSLPETPRGVSIITPPPVTRGKSGSDPARSRAGAGSHRRRKLLPGRDQVPGIAARSRFVTARAGRKTRLPFLGEERRALLVKPRPRLKDLPQMEERRFLERGSHDLKSDRHVFPAESAR